VLLVTLKLTRLQRTTVRFRIVSFSMCGAITRRRLVALRLAMAASTSANPLHVAAEGPMQVVGEALFACPTAARPFRDDLFALKLERCSRPQALVRARD